MKVLIGLVSFDQPGGSESYVLTAARELRRLGHDVVIATRERGPVAKQAEQASLPVAQDAANWPERCDAIFAHDAIMAGECAARYPGTRLVYFAHSTLYDHQLPILVDGVVAAVVAASDLVADRMRALPLNVPIVRLRHPIDTEHFVAGPIRDRPRRALLLGNYLNGKRRQALIEAWTAAGVECVQVGQETQPQLDVVPAIAQADIVVAKARAALEGMSCGRAVYIYDAWGGDGWVTPERYPGLEANNFAGIATAEPRGPHELAGDLGDYSTHMGWVNRELVVRHHSARRHAQELVHLLRGPAPLSQDGVTAVSEMARLAGIGWHAQREATAQRAEADAWRERTLAAERELVRARTLLETRRARAGIALGKSLDRLRRFR